MPARIDRVTLTLDVYDSELWMRREIRFAVDTPDQQAPLVLAVREAWDEWYARILAEARSEPGPIGFL